VICSDLADPGAAWRLVVAAARARGGLDALVNSAARFARTPFASTSLAQYDRLLDLNLRGAFFCSQAAVRAMACSGHIINISDAATGWGHSGTVDEVAAGVVFFATCPRYITGQILAVDGGEGAGA